MAKKRVHELAKQYDMPSSEVMKRLQAYGLEVKAAATAVDTELADAALTGKPKPKASSNGAKKKQAPQPPPHTGVGFDRPAPRAPRPPDNKPEAPSGDKPREGQGGGNRDGNKRPTRSSLQGERAPGAGGGVRRVVIDSQASRRQGGPGGGPPGPQRRPPRRGGRRRRGAYVEPVPQDKTTLQADTIRVNSGSTVKDVAEYLGVPIPEVIKKLMQLGEMATLTQTLSDDAIQVLADEFDKEIEIV